MIDKMEIHKLENAIKALKFLYNLEISVYPDTHGRCDLCHAETLWGDAPHGENCPYAGLIKWLESKLEIKA